MNPCADDLEVPAPSGSLYRKLGLNSGDARCADEGGRAGEAGCQGERHDEKGFIGEKQADSPQGGEKHGDTEVAQCECAPPNAMGDSFGLFVSEVSDGHPEKEYGDLYPGSALRHPNHED
jgi:hypothetical protein